MCFVASRLHFPDSCFSTSSLSFSIVAFFDLISMSLHLMSLGFGCVLHNLIDIDFLPLPHWLRVEQRDLANLQHCLGCHTETRRLSPDETQKPSSVAMCFVVELHHDTVIWRNEGHLERRTQLVLTILKSEPKHAG